MGLAEGLEARRGPRGLVELRIPTDISKIVPDTAMIERARGVRGIQRECGVMEREGGRWNVDPDDRGRGPAKT